MPGTATLGQRESNGSAGHSGWEGPRVVSQLLSPAACRLLQPSSLYFDYLAFFSQSSTLWKWYRLSLPQKLLKQIQQQPDCRGFRASQWDAGTPALCRRRKDEHPHPLRGNCFAHRRTSYSSENLGVRTLIN